jgi:hypothetical protein
MSVFLELNLNKNALEFNSFDWRVFSHMYPIKRSALQTQFLYLIFFILQIFMIFTVLVKDMFWPGGIPYFSKILELLRLSCLYSLMTQSRLMMYISYVVSVIMVILLVGLFAYFSFQSLKKHPPNLSFLKSGNSLIRIFCLVFFPIVVNGMGFEVKFFIEITFSFKQV